MEQLGGWRLLGAQPRDLQNSNDQQPAGSSNPVQNNGALSSPGLTPMFLLCTGSNLLYNKLCLLCMHLACNKVNIKPTLQTYYGFDFQGAK
jgi:hypothetical protein